MCLCGLIQDTHSKFSQRLDTLIVLLKLPSRPVCKKKILCNKCADWATKQETRSACKKYVYGDHFRSQWGPNIWKSMMFDNAYFVSPILNVLSCGKNF